jgi:hypothetical protein
VQSLPALRRLPACALPGGLECEGRGRSSGRRYARARAAARALESTLPPAPGAAEPRSGQLSSRRSARKRQTCGLVALFGASRTRNGDRRGAPAAPVRCGDASNLTAFTARQLCRRSRCGVCMQPPSRAAPGEIRRRSRSAAAKGARRRRPHPPVPPPSLKLSLGDVRRRRANLAAATTHTPARLRTVTDSE